jgi:hypothetical protein
MQLRWLYTAPDGSLVVVGSAHVDQLARDGFDTPEKVRALVVGKFPVGATDIEEMPEGWLPPTDRTFRNAWRRAGKAVEGVPHAEEPRIAVEMPVAREIHRDWIRRKRIARFTELDRAYLRADEDNDKAEKARLVVEKRRLRDLPNDPRIDAAKSPETLKLITLDP